jgi:ABC-type transport system involved in multi-copper enzyme maturation permease subunit
MTQLWAIVRYEVLMAWRRRSLPILWLLLLVGVVGFSLLIESVNREQPVLQEGLEQTVADANANAPEWAQGIDMAESARTVSLINVLIAGLVFYTVGVTLMSGETIPLDRQFKVSELLETLPISRTVYLAGKVLGAWAGLLVGTAVVGVIAALAIRLIIGTYDVRVFAALWVGMMVPASLVAAAVSVLLASFVGSRRSAVMIGLIIMPFVLFLMTLAVTAFAGVGALIEPIYAIGILLPPGDAANAEIVNRIRTTLLTYAGVLAFVWALAWGDAHRRGSR